MIEINSNRFSSWRLFSTFILFYLSSTADCFSQEHIVKHVNKNWKIGKGSWEAKKYPFKYPGFDEKFVHENRRPHDSKDYLLRALIKQSAKAQLPEEFDARKKWPHCKTMCDIADQGKCGSCWAVAATSAINDRICIQHPELTQVRVSASVAMDCIGNHSCLGNSPYKVWQYFKEHGLPTGGPFGSKDTCQPYRHKGNHFHALFTIPPLLKFHRVHSCPNYCVKTYKKSFKDDLMYGRTAYRLPVYDTRVMMTNILSYGPIITTIKIYDDFHSYKSGIYHHQLGNSTKLHAVKVIGWGTENGTDYWLCANSWSRYWGEKGFFRVQRGTNEVGIESVEVSAGIPA